MCVRCVHYTLNLTAVINRLDFAIVLIATLHAVAGSLFVSTCPDNKPEVPAQSVRDHLHDSATGSTTVDTHGQRNLVRKHHDDNYKAGRDMRHNASSAMLPQVPLLRENCCGEMKPSEC